MAAMPIYDKNLWKSSSQELNAWWPGNLVCIIWYSGSTKFVQIEIINYSLEIIKSDMQFLPNRDWNTAVSFYDPIL